MTTQVCSLPTVTEVWKGISEVGNKNAHWVLSPSAGRLRAVYSVALPDGPVAETLTFTDAVLCHKRKCSDLKWAIKCFIQGEFQFGLVSPQMQNGEVSGLLVRNIR